MKRATLTLLLVLFVLTAVATAAYGSGFTSVTRNLVVLEENLIPFSMTFLQCLSYDSTDTGDYRAVTASYNDGLLRNYYAYPFSWDVIPGYFRWYQNGSVICDFADFYRDYSVYHDPDDRVWGGRNTSEIVFYLPGNTRGQRISSAYFSVETYPGAVEFSLSYGITDQSRVASQSLPGDTSDIHVLTEASVSQQASLATASLSINGPQLSIAASKNIIQSSKEASLEIAELQVGNRQFSQRHVEILVQLANAYGRDQSRKDVQDELITSELCYQEAVKNGLQVSRDEAKAYAEQVKADLKTCENSDDMNMLLNTVMESMGMTEQEYWDWAVDGYERALSIGNLKASFTDKDGNYNEEGFMALGKDLYEKAEVSISTR